MYLNQNIAYYRRLCGYTQEQLAERLGVTGQSVSKWENELSNPDISILPDLAKALGVDINSLFEETPNAPKGVQVSELSALCYDALVSLFAKAEFTFYHGEATALTSERLNKRMEALKKEFDFPLPKCAYVIDEGEPEHSSVFLSDALSFVDRSYGGSDSALLFDLDKAGELLTVLGDKNARKILKVIYEKLVSEGEGGTFFSPQKLSKATSLTEDAVSAAAVKLRHVGLIDEVEKIEQAGFKKEYCTLYPKDFIFVLAILRLAYVHTSNMTCATLMYRDANNQLNYNK
ncbi:MAG: helix-turn-helix transcriptional regulator [Clostridia bacterium]|nr:helix-turn-helix transcriptional regulator [Clostridia bacterium]